VLVAMLAKLAVEPLRKPYLGRGVGAGEVNSGNSRRETEDGDEGETTLSTDSRGLGEAISKAGQCRPQPQQVRTRRWLVFSSTHHGLAEGASRFARFCHS
jgi:hypothetical protein